MSQLYDRAEIYDLIESKKRTEIIRRDGWEVLPGQIVPCDYCENRNDCVSAYFESLYDKEQQPECPFK